LAYWPHYRCCDPLGRAAIMAITAITVIAMNIVGAKYLHAC